MVVVWIIVAVIVLAVLWAVATYNRLVSLRNESASAFSGIDVQLKRRADLIPNLVETVKGYAAHESTTFEKITEARAQTLQAKGIDQTAQADTTMRQALGGLFAVAENYPDLKASQNFLALQGELSDTEDKIAAARRYYNNVVRRFDTLIQQFPASLVAGSFEAQPYYQVGDEADRAPVSVTFAGGAAAGGGAPPA